MDSVPAACYLGGDIATDLIYKTTAGMAGCGSQIAKYRHTEASRNTLDVSDIQFLSSLSSICCLLPQFIWRVGLLLDLPNQQKKRGPGGMDPL